MPEERGRSGGLFWERGIWVLTERGGGGGDVGDFVRFFVGGDPGADEKGFWGVWWKD